MAQAAEDCVSPSHGLHQALLANSPNENEDAEDRNPNGPWKMDYGSVRPNLCPAMPIEDLEQGGQPSSPPQELPPPKWSPVRAGSSFRRITKSFPTMILEGLRDREAFSKLVTFCVPEMTALLAFGRGTILTRGSRESSDKNCKDEWLKAMDDKVKLNFWGKKFYESGWEQKVDVAAYVVNFKDAAAGGPKSLLSQLLKKTKAGATDDEIWDSPALRAIVEYKWRHWARFYFIRALCFYLGWVLSYVALLVFYVDCYSEKEFSGDDSQRDWQYSAIAASEAAALLFMSPFLILDFNSILHYKHKWFLEMWNLINLCTYVIQVCIAVIHFAMHPLYKNRYNDLMAVQCVLLFMRLQYYAGAFGAGGSFVDLLREVLYRVRWFFCFMFVTLMSMALSFAVLYKRDTGRETNSEDDWENITTTVNLEVPNTRENADDIGVVNVTVANTGENADEDFSSVLRAIVTTFAVLQGSFESGYVFHTENRTAKAVFFLFFQVTMSITALNLLVAVLTESYSSIMDKARVMYNMGRARAMEKLEASLPKRWGPKLEPYCHFLLIEKKSAPLNPHLCELADSMKEPASFLRSQHSIRNEFKQLSRTVEELKNTVAEMAGVPKGQE